MELERTWKDLWSKILAMREITFSTYYEKNIKF